MLKQRGRGRFVFFCVAPAVLLFSIFILYPTFNVFRLSLYKDWSNANYDNMRFVGFENFTSLFQQPNFIRSMQNTLLIIVAVTVVTLALALLFAGILTREKVKAKGFFRVIFYIPNILSIVVVAGIFRSVFDGATTSPGLLNSFLNIFRGSDVAQTQFLDQKMVMYSIIFAMIWQAIGYYMVMYMASMAAVPESLYESADLEGCGHIRQFFTITIPLVWNNIRTTLTFFVISTINIAFLLVTNMTDGGPDGASEVFLTYMFRMRGNNQPFAMAVTVVIFLFSFALSALINVITKRDVVEM